MNDFSQFHLSEEPLIKSGSIPGKRSKKLLEIQKEIEGSVVSYPKSMPFAINHAKGAIIEDVDGNRFIDFFSGCGVLNVGHCNEEVLSYVREQQDKLIHALDFPTETKLTVIRKMLQNLPEDIRNDFKVSFGGPTGSDAVEAAIKLAKIKTGRDGIIAFSGGYHGMSSGALAVTSDTRFRNGISSLMPNVHFAPFSYYYRSPADMDEVTYTKHCLEQFRLMLEDKHSGIIKPAAILVEPIQGEGGNITPTKGFLQGLINIAHRNDVLVIFDEIQSGFFRSGEYLACMKYDVIPDIITMSKGLGGIGFPISALLYKKSVEAWKSGDHIGTFRANQVSLAAANGAFDFIEKYDVKSYVNEISNYLFSGLRALAVGCKFIGDVRGEGLMIGVEFVKNKATKEPYPEFVKEFRENCLQRGLLFEVGGHYDNVVRILPPLIVTPKIIDEALNVMGEALKASILENLKESLNIKAEVI